VGLAALGDSTGDGAVISSGISSGSVPAGPAHTHGAGAGIAGSDQVILNLGGTGSDELQIEVHSILELGSIDGGLIVAVDDPAAVGQQDGQEVDDQVILAVATIDEAQLTIGLGLFADRQHILQGQDGVTGVTGGFHVGLVVQQDGHVAVVGSQIQVIAHIADGGGGGDHVLIQRVAQLGEVGQNAVLGELCHPGAVHHAQVIGALVIDGVQSDAGVQVALRELLHLADNIVLSLESGQALLDHVGIGAAAQDQGQLGGFCGGIISGSIAVRGSLGLTAAAGGQRQGHSQRQDQGQRFFHLVFLLI